jgi:Bacterial regulatory proteins, luxR family
MTSSRPTIAIPTAVRDRLRVTPKTVSNHVSNILAKLQLADRTQAAVAARDAGLGGRRVGLRH